MDVCKQRRYQLQGPEQVVGLLTVRCVVRPQTHATPAAVENLFAPPLQPQGDDFAARPPRILVFESNESNKSEEAIAWILRAQKA